MNSLRNRALAGVLVAAVLAALAGCSLKKETAEDPSAFQWRSGRIEQASNAQVQGTEDRDARIAMGLMGGFVGLAFALGTEKDLGKAAVWRYQLRDGETPVYLQSFSVFQVGDCVRYAMGANPADTPMEKLPTEQCGAAR
ncbi:MAG: hypothetical protein AB7R90_17780 [Reyranellaceae bacterium]